MITTNLGNQSGTGGVTESYRSTISSTVITELIETSLTWCRIIRCLFLSIAAVFGITGTIGPTTSCCTICTTAITNFIQTSVIWSVSISITTNFCSRDWDWRNDNTLIRTGATWLTVLCSQITLLVAKWLRFRNTITTGCSGSTVAHQITFQRLTIKRPIVTGLAWVQRNTRATVTTQIRTNLAGTSTVTMTNGSVQS